MSALTVRLRRLDYDPRRGPVGEVLGRFEWGGGVGQSRDVWLPADVFTALSTQLDRPATAEEPS